MNCKKCLKNLDNYISNELSGNISEKIREHIENCPDCKKRYEEDVALKKLLCETRDTEAPDNLHETIMCSVRTEMCTNEKDSAEQLRPSRRKYWALAASLCVVAICVSVYLGIPALKFAKQNSAIEDGAHYAVNDKSYSSPKDLDENYNRESGYQESGISDRPSSDSDQEEAISSNTGSKMKYIIAGTKFTFEEGLPDFVLNENSKKVSFINDKGIEYTGTFDYSAYVITMKFTYMAKEYILTFEITNGTAVMKSGQKFWEQ